MTLLINQLDEHNESGIIYLIKNKVEEVLFLYDTEQEDLMKSIKDVVNLPLVLIIGVLFIKFFKYKAI